MPTGFVYAYKEINAKEIVGWQQVGPRHIVKQIELVF